MSDDFKKKSEEVVQESRKFADAMAAANDADASPKTKVWCAIVHAILQSGGIDDFIETVRSMNLYTNPAFGHQASGQPRMLRSNTLSNSKDAFQSKRANTIRAQMARSNTLKQGEDNRPVLDKRPTLIRKLTNLYDKSAKEDEEPPPPPTYGEWTERKLRDLFSELAPQVTFRDTDLETWMESVEQDGEGVLSQTTLEEYCKQVYKIKVKQQEKRGGSKELRSSISTEQFNENSGRSAAVDRSMCWQVCYCGGSKPVIKDLAKITEDLGMPFQVEKFDW